MSRELGHVNEQHIHLGTVMIAVIGNSVEASLSFPQQLMELW